MDLTEFLKFMDVMAIEAIAGLCFWGGRLRQPQEAPIRASEYLLSLPLSIYYCSVHGGDKALVTMRSAAQLYVKFVLTSKD